MAHSRKVSVVGLGYVGLPVAVAFGKSTPVVGFDINEERLAELRAHHDRTNEVTTDDLRAATVTYTADPAVLASADFHIVAVPTPVDDAHQPDLTPVVKASESVGRVLKRGDIVVYESTVYPGVTEDVCVPILERLSGLRCGPDFSVGYSPERINPGDKEHTFTKIKKVVSGLDAATLDIVASVYESVVVAGVHKAASIKVAEAAKVIENTQRDLNIALMNELAIIFEKMGIDTLDVLEAAGTKWNFLKFRPGLVGGHCIGVDPYYLTHKAERLGYIPQVILSGRRINDGMGAYIAQAAIKQLIRTGHDVAHSTITILGLTFKEDCPDLRNSRVIDIIRELQSFGVKIQVADPEADRQEALHEYGVDLVRVEDLAPAQAVIVAVAHRAFKDYPVSSYQRLLVDGGVVLDVKGVCDRTAFAGQSIHLWRL
jgi:UDP-N-acetyl-D-glucosamine/UDP-N-acetyl-D-galactosamine dehydrogenase